MKIPEKIVGFLNENRGLAFCDDCLREGCGVKSAGEAARVTSTLELFPEFRRSKSVCSKCGSTRRLTSKAV